MEIFKYDFSFFDLFIRTLDSMNEERMKLAITAINNEYLYINYSDHLNNYSNSINLQSNSNKQKNGRNPYNNQQYYLKNSNNLQFNDFIFIY